VLRARVKTRLPDTEAFEEDATVWCDAHAKTTYFDVALRFEHGRLVSWRYLVRPFDLLQLLLTPEEQRELLLREGMARLHVQGVRTQMAKKLRREPTDGEVLGKLTVDFLSDCTNVPSIMRSILQVRTVEERS